MENIWKIYGKYGGIMIEEREIIHDFFLCETQKS
jgi:hypothetical protein